MRRRTVLVAATVAVAGSAIAVAGCGGDSQTGAAPGEVASYVPAASPMYLELTTDVDGPQWTQVEKLARLFPAYPEFERMLDEELSGEGVDFERDVKPLLGDRAAVAALSLPDVSDTAGALTSGETPTLPGGAGDEQFVGVVEVADGKEDAVKALLTREGATRAGERGGAEYYTTPDDDTVVAVAPGAVVVADDTTSLFQALDAHEKGGDATLAGTDKFTDALGKLPADVFGQAYMDIGSIARASGASQQLEQAGIAGIEDTVFAASIAAEPDGVRVKGVVLDAPEQPQTEFTPTLTAQAPADSIAYLGFSNLTGVVEQVLNQVRGTADEETRQQIDAFAGQLPALLGVGVDDLAALGSGEHAVVVSPGTPDPGVALALKVADGARAGATLDKLRAGIPGLLNSFSPGTTLPAWQQVDLAHGVKGWRLPLSPEAGVVYGVDGDLAVVGSTVSAITSLQAPTAPLASSEAFQQGTAGMPDKVTGLAWINLQEGVDVLNKYGAFDDAPAEVLANLAPAKSLAAWTTGGSEPTFEVFLRLAQ
ncbi:MAG: DUF3352 domain-containing protein [Thermoleophilia bacterium]